MCERSYTYEEKKLMNDFKLKTPHICVYCDKELRGKDIVTIDHKIPICRGGETVEENLAIACCLCNQEKDDMTVEEYAIYKQKQLEFKQDSEVNKIMDDLIIMQNYIISKSVEINNSVENIEKEITALQQDIMCGNFNAYEGFLYTKTLNELLLKREELKITKIGYNHLNILMGIQRKNTIDIRNKVQTEVNKAKKIFLKGFAIGKCKKRSKSKVAYISEAVGTEPSIVKNIPVLVSKVDPAPIQLTSSNKKLQVISKVDEDHYVVKNGHHMQVMLTKNIPNLDRLQLAQ
jgi:hypothetical protein